MPTVTSFAPPTTSTFVVDELYVFAVEGSDFLISTVSPRVSLVCTDNDMFEWEFNGLASSSSSTHLNARLTLKKSASFNQEAYDQAQTHVVGHLTITVTNIDPPFEVDGPDTNIDAVDINFVVL